MNSKYDPAMLSIRCSHGAPQTLLFSSVFVPQVISAAHPALNRRSCRISGGIPKSGPKASPAQVNALAGRFMVKVKSAVLSRANNGTSTYGFLLYITHVVPAVDHEVMFCTGAWITGCHEHCGQWTQGQIAGGNSDFNTTIGGTTAPFAVRDWYLANRAAFFARRAGGGGEEKEAGVGKHREAGVGKHVHTTAAVYPCKNCCAGGNGP